MFVLVSQLVVLGCCLLGVGVGLLLIVLLSWFVMLIVVVC